MADTIQELRERKAKLIEELNLIDQYLKLHERLFPRESGGNKSRLAGVNVQPRSEGEEKNDPRVVADRAEEVIRAQGRPLQRGEIVRYIMESGLPLYTKDKGKYLGTILWRHRDRFVNIPELGYWIKGLPIEAPPSELPLNQ
jgi:hypothetical protein